MMIIFSVAVKAQSSDQFIGNWKFKDVSSSDPLDSTQRAMLKQMFAEMVIDLKADKKYHAFLFGKEEGTWKYDDAQKMLTLTSTKAENKIPVLGITDKELTLELEKGQGLILEKSPQ